MTMGLPKVKLTFKDVVRVVDGHWDDGTSGFFCHLHAAFLKRKQVGFLLVLIAGTLWENPDGYPFFDVINAEEDGFQSLFEVFTV